MNPHPVDSKAWYSLCRSDTWFYWWEEKRIPHWSYTFFFSILFLSFLLSIPAPYLSPSFPLSLQFSSFLSVAFPFPLCNFSNSLVKGFPMSIFYVPKPMVGIKRCKNEWDSCPTLEEFSICLGCIRIPQYLVSHKESYSRVLRCSQRNHQLEGSESFQIGYI